MYLDKQILLKICQISPLQILTCLGANTRKLRVLFYFTCKFCVGTNPILVSEESFQFLKKTKSKLQPFLAEIQLGLVQQWTTILSKARLLLRNIFFTICWKFQSNVIQKRIILRLFVDILCFEVSYKNNFTFTL